MKILLLDLHKYSYLFFYSTRAPSLNQYVGRRIIAKKIIRLDEETYYICNP